jgi:hypothetical protein
MQNLFLSTADAAARIASGQTMLLAGAAENLAALPRGAWVGGTTAYFMTADGGRIVSDKIFCTILDDATACRISVLRPGALDVLTRNRYAQGFAVVLIPAFTAIHEDYALHAPGLHGLYDQPVMGWVTGVHLDELATRKPCVFDGATGTSYTDAGVVMHVAVPPDCAADIDIVNLFSQGDGPTFRFSDDGFTVGACTVDGEPANFAEYCRGNAIDTKLPLVADYAGAMVNASIREVQRGKVSFYAPIVSGQAYRFARPVADYAAMYGKIGLDEKAAARSMSCNCVLNFVYAGLEGKPTAGFIGPVTFGEIAFIVLNQTLVRLDVMPAPKPRTIREMEPAFA